MKEAPVMSKRPFIGGCGKVYYIKYGNLGKSYCDRTTIPGKLVALEHEVSF